MSSNGTTLPPLRIAVPPLSRRALKEWWHAESGYRDVLQLAWPLFFSNGLTAILQMIDRMFLTWYSAAGMAAVGSSGMLAFALQALFIGLTGYTATFVAQYTGAEKPRQAVAAVWHGIYLAIIASLVMLLLLPIGPLVFHLAGHDPKMQAFERTFFTISIFGSFAAIAAPAVNAYFIGLGKTRTVLWINMTAVVVTIALDYLLIFGKFGFPKMGVAGAAIATITAQFATLLVGGALFLHDTRPLHATGAWRPDLALAKRMFRYGMASGVQFSLDMVGWTTFLLLIGRLGVTQIAASNLAFQINSIAFFPILGFGMAAATLVGQNLGKNRPDHADRAVWSSLHLATGFTCFAVVLFLGVPRLLLAPFGALANPAEFIPVREFTVIMLRFVAAYCLFDVGNLILGPSLKGAGDTLYVMYISTGCSIVFMLLPTALWCIQPGGPGIFGAWTFLTITVCAASISFYIRYLRGHWREMRVIEHDVID